jgi:hypothetical protein
MKNKTGAESEGDSVEAKVGSKSMPIKHLLETYILYQTPRLTSSDDHRSELRHGFRNIASARDMMKGMPRRSP